MIAGGLIAVCMLQFDGGAGTFWNATQEAFAATGDTEKTEDGFEIVTRGNQKVLVKYTNEEEKKL